MSVFEEAFRDHQQEVIDVFDSVQVTQRRLLTAMG